MHLTTLSDAPPECPTGHGLTRWRNRSELRCDGPSCQTPILQRGDWRWSCTLCDYDVCEECAQLMLNIEAAAPKSTSPVTVPAAALQKPPAPNPVVRSKPVSTPVEKKPRVSGGIAHPTNMALAGTTDSPATLPARTSGLQVPSHDPCTPLPLEEVRRDLQYSDRKRKPDALDETGGGGEMYSHFIMQHSRNPHRQDSCYVYAILWCRRRVSRQ